MEKLDGRQVLPNIYCEADDLLYLQPAVLAHSVSVEMLNLSDKIDQLQKEVGRSIAEMNDSIKSLSAKAVPTAANGHSSRTAMTSSPATASKDDLACHANILWSPSIVQDKTRNDEILSYSVRRDIPVVDAFCLGKQKRPTTDQSVEGNSESRPRPVLVKLGCVWDCKVVLLAKHKL